LTKKYIAGDAIYACATKLFAEQAKNPAFAGRLMIEPRQSPAKLSLANFL
jgi:hypothetical protein